MIPKSGGLLGEPLLDKLLFGDLGLRANGLVDGGFVENVCLLRPKRRLALFLDAAAHQHRAYLKIRPDPQIKLIRPITIILF